MAPNAAGVFTMHTASTVGEGVTPSADDSSATEALSLDGRFLTLRAIQRQAIELRLHHFEGRKPRAAASLGISLKTIYNKLNAYRKEDAKAARSWWNLSILLRGGYVEVKPDLSAALTPFTRIAGQIGRGCD